MTSRPPNLFEFATSELSQDAVIAYFLRWADPLYSTVSEAMHRLGTAFARELMAKASPKNQLPAAIHHIEVGRQRDNIDVWFAVNDEWFVLIEDKTGTNETEKQIAAYVSRVGEFTTRGGKPYSTIGAVYLKTMNETRKTANKSHCGVFFRRDFLLLLGQFAGSMNAIGEEFLCHLEIIERNTIAYRTTPIACGWDAKAIEGFYMDFEQALHERGQAKDVDWEYVPNPMGGFIGFHWCWREANALGCEMYLQIENASRLQLRLADWDAGVDSARLYKCFSAGQSLAASDSRFEALNPKKSGRFRGGKTAGVFTFFEDCPLGFRVAKADGCLDLEQTMERLFLTIDFADILSRAN